MREEASAGGHTSRCQSLCKVNSNNYDILYGIYLHYCRKRAGTYQIPCIGRVIPHSIRT